MILHRAAIGPFLAFVVLPEGETIVVSNWK